MGGVGLGLGVGLVGLGLGLGMGIGVGEANRQCRSERSVQDEDMKFGVVVLRVQAPPGQSLASGPVASLAAASVTMPLMRRQANE